MADEENIQHPTDSIKIKISKHWDVEETKKLHCVKSVRIRSYSGPHFSRDFPYLDWILWDTLSGEKKVGEKWLNFLQVTQFFRDEIFLQLSFSRPVLLLDIFSPDKEFIPIFFSIIVIIIIIIIIITVIIIIIFPIYLQNLLLPCFYWCTLFILVEQRIFNKNFEMLVKARRWKT